MTGGDRSPTRDGVPREKFEMPAAPQASSGPAASPLVVDLARKIADLIRLGVVGVGEKLQTQTHAQRFDVSRSPVREALGPLARPCLLEQRPNPAHFPPPSALGTK